MKEIWARVGVSMTVNEKEFQEDPEKAIKNALANGNAFIDGETYLPDIEENDPHSEREFNLDKMPIKVLVDEITNS